MAKATTFFYGLGVGVALGLLLAPTSGEETRRLIRNKADEGKDYLKRRTEDLRETAGDLIERSKQMMEQQKDNLAAAIEAGKQAYRETVSQPITRSQPAPPM